MTLTLSYNDVLKRRRAVKSIPGRLLSIDPGDMTGIAVFDNGYLSPDLFDNGRHQFDTTLGNVGIKLEKLFDDVMPDKVVCEAYRIYSDRAIQHVNSDVPTLRLIGRIEQVCDVRRIPVVFQMASEGKSFATDALLDKWGIARSNENHNLRHSKDAVRHGVHYLLFK